MAGWKESLVYVVLLSVVYGQALGTLIDDWIEEIDYEDHDYTASDVVVDVVSASTGFVKVSWQREESWAEVTNFTVTVQNFTAEDVEDSCLETIYCDIPECTFDSQVVGCPELDPCSDVRVLVEGNSTFGQSEDFITAPVSPTGVQVMTDENILTVTWDAPDAGSCIGLISIKARFNDNHISSIKNVLPSLERTPFLMTMCHAGNGQVDVSAKGNSTHEVVSDSVSKSFTYYGNGSTPIVGPLQLNFNYDTVQVLWSVLEPCTNILTMFKIELNPMGQEPDPEGQVHYTPDSTTTSTIFTGLDSHMEHKVCVQPMGDGTLILGQPECEVFTTLSSDPEELLLKAINSTAIEVAWLPVTDGATYTVSVDSCGNASDTACTSVNDACFQCHNATATPVTFNSLMPNTVHNVCVYEQTEFENRTCNDLKTLPTAPWDLAAVTSDSSLVVSWRYTDEPALYTVTWDYDNFTQYDTTDETRYLIETTEGTTEWYVCVTATLDGTESLATCGEFQYQNLVPTNNFSVIAGVIVGLPLSLVAAGLLVAYALKVDIKGAFPGLKYV